MSLTRRQILATLALAPLAPTLDAFTHKTSVNLYQPARLLFVADPFSYSISVIDLIAGQAVEHLSTAIKPRVMEMARDDAMLAYANPAVRGIFFINLRSNEQFSLKLPSPVYQIIFIPRSRLVAVAMSDRVGLIDYSERKVMILDKIFDSPQRETFLRAYFSLAFSTFSQSYFVLDELRPRIYRYRNNEWRTYDFEKQFGNYGIGRGVVGAEEKIIAFTLEDGHEAFIFFVDEQQLISTGPMAIDSVTEDPLVPPYIDARSRRIAFADQQGHVALFDLKHSKKAERMTLDFAPALLRMGWRDQSLIVGGDRGLMMLNMNDRSQIRTWRFREKINDIWVTGDSKTALITLDEGIPTLFRYDIRQQKLIDQIFIPNVADPKIIRMGSNNSICY